MEEMARRHGGMEARRDAHGELARPRNGLLHSFPLSAVRACVLLAFLLITTTPGFAADLKVNISSPNGWVNDVLTLQVEIESSDRHAAPELPEIAGATVRSAGGPSTSSFTRILNGRITHRETVTYQFYITPTRPGALTIPPITAVIDGQEFTSPPIEVHVKESETGDLMFVTITAPESVFLGEPVDVVMHLYVRPFEGEYFPDGMSEGMMWNLIQRNGTHWGAFLQPLEQLMSQASRMRGASSHPSARNIMHAPDDGEPRRYYEYQLAARLWPTQLSPFAPDKPRIFMNYPVRITRRRDVFDGWQYQLAQSRPIGATATINPVTVLEAPEQGRPPSFTGAIGLFDIDVTAKPTHVSVGDPITLTITLTDQRPGRYQMDLLRPPALDQINELTDAFRVPTELMAGVVDRNRKTFTQTVRPTHDGVTQIPAIAYASFDPVTEQYRVVTSDPIPITITAASTMAMTDIVGADNPPTANASELTAFAGGILANHAPRQTGAGDLLADHGFEPSWPMAIVVGAPPLLFVFVAVGHRRVRRLKTDEAYARRRSAHRIALSRLTQAQRLDHAEQADAVAAALRGYLADRFDLPPGAQTRADVINRLEQTRINGDLLSDIQNTLSHSEQLRYAGGADASLDLPASARRCIDRLQQERLG